RGATATASHRLDLRAELLGETTGKPLVMIGKSEDSRLIHAVTGKTPGKLMPRKGPPLTERAIGLLRAWIHQGLPWHDRLSPAAWHSDRRALHPTKPPPIPKVETPAGARRSIDAFRPPRKAGRGLSPGSAADSRTLLRRLYLGLTGLPPAPEEVDQFVPA